MVLFWFFRSKRLVQLFMTFFSVCRISLAGPALHVLRALLDLRIPHMANNVCVTLLCGIQKHSLRLWMSDLVCLSQNTMTTNHGCSLLSKIHAIPILVRLYQNGWDVTQGRFFFSSKYMPTPNVVRSSFSSLHSNLLFLQISLLWTSKIQMKKSMFVLFGASKNQHDASWWPLSLLLKYKHS